MCSGQGHTVEHPNEKGKQLPGAVQPRAELSTCSGPAAHTEPCFNFTYFVFLVFFFMQRGCNVPASSHDLEGADD